MFTCRQEGGRMEKGGRINQKMYRSRQGWLIKTNGKCLLQSSDLIFIRNEVKPSYVRRRC